MHTLSTYRFFFFNDTATTEIYTLSLHDALPIWEDLKLPPSDAKAAGVKEAELNMAKQLIEGMSATWSADQFRDSFKEEDRKSTRLNSSHANISYAVFCLKKKYSARQELRRSIL